MQQDMLAVLVLFVWSRHGATACSRDSSSTVPDLRHSTSLGALTSWTLEPILSRSFPIPATRLAGKWLRHALHKTHSSVQLQLHNSLTRLMEWPCGQLLPWLWTSGSGASALYGAVLLLNSPRAIPALLPAVWRGARLRACADGAANRLLAAHPELPAPAVILGDFDSARPEVLRHYEALGSAVVRRPDQNATDLEKLLRYPPLHDARLHGPGRAAAVCGGMGGFFSHQAANLHAAIDQDVRLQPLVFLDDNEVCIVLRPGRTVFLGSPPGTFLSLIPMFGAVDSVRTTGLKWELNGSSLEFGHLISSSNRVADNVWEISVETSHHLLCCLEKRD